jgi:phosphopantothenate synthetase
MTVNAMVMQPVVTLGQAIVRIVNITLLERTVNRVRLVSMVLRQVVSQTQEKPKKIF